MRTSTDEESQPPATDVRSARESFESVAARYPRAEARSTPKEEGLNVADRAFAKALEACAGGLMAPDGNCGK